MSAWMFLGLAMVLLGCSLAIVVYTIRDIRAFGDALQRNTQTMARIQVLTELEQQRSLSPELAAELADFRRVARRVAEGRRQEEDPVGRDDG